MQHIFSTNHKHLNKALEAVNSAVKKDSRLALQGVCFDVSDNEVSLVATDGKRLIVSDLKATEIVNGAHSFTIRKSDLQNLKGLRGTLHFYFDSNMFVEVLSDEGDHTYKIVPDKFPAWRHLLPSEEGSQATIDVDKLLKLAGGKIYRAKAADKRGRGCEVISQEGVIKARMLKYASDDMSDKRLAAEDNTEEFVPIGTGDITDHTFDIDFLLYFARDAKFKEVTILVRGQEDAIVTDREQSSYILYMPIRS